MTVRRSPTLRSRVLPVTAARHISPEYTKALHATMKASKDHHGNEHARYRDVNPDVRAKYDAFAIVRNPWNRVASRYWFAVKVIQHEKKQPESYCNVSSFRAFLEERHKWGGKEYFWHRAVRGWFPQRDYIVNESGDVSVDCLRFEGLEREITSYFHMRKPFSDPRRNVTGIATLTKDELFDKETIQIVADWYKDDIDHFGFDYDTSATKNIWALDGKQAS